MGLIPQYPMDKCIILVIYPLLVIIYIDNILPLDNIIDYWLSILDIHG